MINWQYYPKSDLTPVHLKDVISIFQSRYDDINSEVKLLNSNQVLYMISDLLEKQGYKVEKSKKACDKIRVPVLFGRNDSLDKFFEADAYSVELRTVIEVEAGRAVANNQFLKDLFQASVMHEVDFLVIALRNTYRSSKDFERVLSFMNTLFASNRLKLPLKGILIIGY